MPWTVETVDKHKSGLNLSQKKRWVKVANHTLKKCLLDKGKNCEATAIKIASSVVGKRIVK